MALKGSELQQAAQGYFENRGLEVPKEEPPSENLPEQRPVGDRQNDNQEWDYKTSPVNPRGEALPSGAEGWTPFGDPYFGKGLSGTLKRYSWQLMGSPTQGAEEERWAKYLELTSTPVEEREPGSNLEALKLFGQGLAGTEATQESASQDFEKIQEANARIRQFRDKYGDLNLASNRAKMSAAEQAEYEELQKNTTGNIASAAKGKLSFRVGGQNVSLLSPFLRLSKVGFEALTETLGEAAIKLEQAQGTFTAMREYADEQGGALPDLAFDVDREREDRVETAQNVANGAGRLLVPFLASWDAFRFATAPGTLAQKKQAISEGWDAGRLYYSQAIKPALLAEYKRRAAAGEDPQLLAMELQNPWAEAVGQAVLDPLNFIGLAAKTAKAGNMLDKASDAVRGGSLGDEAIELMRDVGKMDETRAAERMGKFDEALAKNIDRVQNERLTLDYNDFSPTSKKLSSQGMAVRAGKNASTVSNIVLNSIMRNGGTADEAADFFSYMSKAVSADKKVRAEAWEAIFTLSNRYGLGRYALSDDVLETGILLRNLTEDKELLTAFRAAKGDLEKTAKILDQTLVRAIAKETPDYKELKAIAEAFKAGKDTSARAEKLARTFEEINPAARAFWEAHTGKVGDVKNAINKNLGKFFFSQPGFVSRNFSNNFMTMFVDLGPTGTVKAYYREGKFWSMGDVEDDLKRWFGGNLPPATQGISLSKSEKAETFVSKLNDKVESGFAKRIYWKNFRDTMDKFLTPGVALPKREEFKALGMTDDMVDYYVHILKNEAAGNTETAFAKFTEKHGEAWRRWNGSVTADEMKGLSETGLTKQIDNISTGERTPQVIQEEFAKLRREQMNRANSAADNPIGVPREREGFEFVEGMNKATEAGMLDVDGTNRLNILIETSERATDELMQAIGKARDTIQDPALRQQFSVMEEAFSASRRNGTRRTSSQLVDTAWDLTKKSKTSTGLQAEQLWNQSILAKTGPAPTGLTAQQFRDELWKATRNDVSNTWETYFSDGFDRLSPLISRLAEQNPQMQGIFQKAQKASSELQMYRTAIYRDGKIFYSQPPKTIYELAERYGISTATGTPQEGRMIPNDRQLLATINKYTEGEKYKTLDDVPLEEAERALQARQNKGMTAADAARVEQPRIPEGGTQEAVQAAPAQATDELGEIRPPTPNPEVQIAPPYVDGSTPIPGQMWKENSDGVLNALNKVEQHMLDNYGLKAVDKLDGSQLKKLKTLMKDASGRTTEAVAIADKVGKEWRDFALLPYGETKNFDLALSYAFPYQFWYSRSYTNWMKRVATDPQVIANYARLKEAMSRINKDSPEWWRYNVEIPSNFLGLGNDHPMSFNLEANLWPLYGLTGTDFNDPVKRTNWMTATVDDMGKFGPSVWSPIQWAIAAYYKTQGEEEVAQSWAGRIIPQTATIKAVSSYFGQPLELDPGVQTFSGEGLLDTAAMDKYERNRVGRAIAGMVQDGLLTQEQGVEVARTQEGPAWDEAVKRATQLRAPGQIMSYFLGVGMKARTEEDKVTDQFYQEYYRLNNLNEAGLVAPEEYQKAWDGLRDKYPFMDALLLSRKAGPDRDRAYAYNVLGRIPPGQSSELYEAVGIDPKTAQKFYDSKGDLSGMNEADRGKFMGAMVDLGAMLAIPGSATKNEWTDARSAYKRVQEQVKQQFGDDIQEKIEHYYSMDDSDQRKAFIDQHPEVQDALTFQNEQVVNDDLLYEYYGGIQALEKYHKNKMYDQLYEKYGEEISKTWDEYYSMQIADPAGAKSFYRKHPELKRYSSDKKKLEEQVLRAVVEFGAKLPEAEKPQLTGNEPQSVGQQNIQEYAQQQTPGFDFWQGELPEVTTILANYWNQGEKIPYAVTKNLDYQARNYGYSSGDDLLRAILISMNR